VSGRRHLAVAVLLLGLTGQATAGRPLITDDAATGGAHRLQLETWVHLDRANAHQDAVLGFGPVETLELSLAVRHGLVCRGDDYSLAGPLAQLKWALRPIESRSWLGLALVAGLGSPFGEGPPRSPSAWRRWPGCSGNCTPRPS
jgi:hypothetical protein